MGRASVGEWRGKFRVFHSHYWYPCLVLLKVWVCSLFDQYDGDFIRDSYQPCSSEPVVLVVYECVFGQFEHNLPPPTNCWRLKWPIGGFCIEALSITDNNPFLIKGQKVNGSTHNNGTLWNDAKVCCNWIFRTKNHSKHLHHPPAPGLWGLWSWTHLTKQTHLEWNLPKFWDLPTVQETQQNLLFVSLWAAWFFEGKKSNLSFTDKLPNIRNWWV